MTAPTPADLEAMADRLKTYAEPLTADDDFQTPLDAEAMLRSLARQALAIPAGWRLAPIEPTEEMVTAGGNAFLDATNGHVAGDLANVNRPFRRYYRAMLAAAPASPAAPSQGEVAALKRHLAERDAQLERSRQRSIDWAGDMGAQCSRAEIAIRDRDAALARAERADRAEALLAEAVKAIEPFAKHASGYESFDGQHDYLDSDEVKLGPFKVTVGDLRRARSLLARIKGA